MKNVFGVHLKKSVWEEIVEEVEEKEEGQRFSYYLWGMEALRVCLLPMKQR